MEQRGESFHHSSERNLLLTAEFSDTIPNNKMFEKHICFHATKVIF